MALAPKHNILEPKVSAKAVEAPKAKLQAVFNPDSSSDEDEEIPVEARYEVCLVGSRSSAAKGFNFTSPAHSIQTFIL